MGVSTALHSLPVAMLVLEAAVLITTVGTSTLAATSSNAVGTILGVDTIVGVVTAAEVGMTAVAAIELRASL